MFEIRIYQLNEKVDSTSGFDIFQSSGFDIYTILK